MTEEVFENIKRAIAEDTVLRYYDVKKPVTVEYDAKWTAGVVCQLRFFSYRAKLLSAGERVSHDMFCPRKFDNYVLGKHVTVITDHKETTVDDVRLQKYELTVCYKKGPEMHISDSLS